MFLAYLVSSLNKNLTQAPLLLSASFRSIPPSDWDAFWLVVVGDQPSLQSFSAALLCDVDEKISVGEVVTSAVSLFKFSQRPSMDQNTSLVNLRYATSPKIPSIVMNRSAKVHIFVILL